MVNGEVRFFGCGGVFLIGPFSKEKSNYIDVIDRTPIKGREGVGQGFDSAHPQGYDSAHPRGYDSAYPKEFDYDHPTRFYNQLNP